MTLASYTSASGMEAAHRSLENTAHNLANVGTTGFKERQIEYQDVGYQNPGAIGADNGSSSLNPTGMQIGNGTQMSSTTLIWKQGDTKNTGEPLHFAIQGNGLFEVEMPTAEGGKAFTRDGSFKVGPDGKVMTTNGYVVSGFPTIPANATSVTVSPTGMLTIQAPGGVQTAQLQIVRFMNPQGLKSLGGNLYESTAASGEALSGTPGNDGFGDIKQHALEMSNVNPVEQMVNMILAQRAYEMNSRVVRTDDEMTKEVPGMKR